MDNKREERMKEREERRRIDKEKERKRMEKRTKITRRDRWRENQISKKDRLKIHNKRGGTERNRNEL